MSSSFVFINDNNHIVTGNMSSISKDDENIEEEHEKQLDYISALNKYFKLKEKYFDNIRNKKMKTYKKLSKDGFEVHAVSVNTGGFNDQEIKNHQDIALKIGATKYTSLNWLDNYYNKVIRFLVFGNILKNETYPLSVSAE